MRVKIRSPRWMLSKRLSMLLVSLLLLLTSGCQTINPAPKRDALNTTIVKLPLFEATRLEYKEDWRTIGAILLDYEKILEINNL